jgi:anti-anti-sigma factor
MSGQGSRTTLTVVTPPPPAAARQPEPLVLRLTGEIDLFNISEVQAELFEALQEGPASTLVIDLSAVTFIDLTALRVLATASRRFDEVVMLNPSPLVARVLDLGRLSHLVRTAYDD